MSKGIVIILAIILIVLGIWFFNNQGEKQTTENQNQSDSSINASSLSLSKSSEVIPYLNKTCQELIPKVGIIYLYPPFRQFSIVGWDIPPSVNIENVYSEDHISCYRNEKVGENIHLFYCDQITNQLSDKPKTDENGIIQKQKFYSIYYKIWFDGRNCGKLSDGNLACQIINSSCYWKWVN